MVLATEPGIWVPAVVLGHLIGICFLLYSLEKTNGSVSRLWKRMTVRGAGKGVGGGAGGVGAAAGGATPVKLMRGMSAGNEPLHYERAPRWVRGCSCKVKRARERKREREERRRKLRHSVIELDDKPTRGGPPQGKRKTRRALGPSRPFLASHRPQLPSKAMRLDDVCHLTR